MILLESSRYLLICEITLELQFENKKIRSLCSSRSYAEKLLGVSFAVELHNRLSDLRAADTIFDLEFIVNLKFDGNKNQYVEFTSKSRGILKMLANNINMPLDENEKIKWDFVDRVKVIGVLGISYD